MKLLILVSIMITTPLFTQAAPNAAKHQPDCDKAKSLQATKPATGNENIKLMGRYVASTADYSVLGAKICTAYVRSKNLTTRIPNLIFDFMRDNEPEIEDPEFELDLVAQKLIDNKHALKCANGEDIIARSFAHGEHYTVMDDIFLGLMAGDELTYDFNAVTRTLNPANNQPEMMTVLDYIEKVELYKLRIAKQKDPDTYTDIYNNLNNFTTKLRRYGARNYEEFTIAEREQLTNQNA